MRVSMMLARLVNQPSDVKSQLVFLPGQVSCVRLLCAVNISVAMNPLLINTHVLKCKPQVFR